MDDSIKRAVQRYKDIKETRRKIIFLTEPPKVHVSMCQAETMSGKPCRCRAVTPCGRFCKKHRL